MLNRSKYRSRENTANSHLLVRTSTALTSTRRKPLRRTQLTVLSSSESEDRGNDDNTNVNTSSWCDLPPQIHSSQTASRNIHEDLISPSSAFSQTSEVRQSRQRQVVTSSEHSGNLSESRFHHRKTPTGSSKSSRSVHSTYFHLNLDLKTIIIFVNLSLGYSCFIGPSYVTTWRYSKPSWYTYHQGKSRVDQYSIHWSSYCLQESQILYWAEYLVL